MRYVLSCIATTALFFSSFLYATTSFNKCMSNAHDDVSISKCFWKANNSADAKLENFYHKLEKKYSANKNSTQPNKFLNALQLNQSEWILFRESSCRQAASLSTANNRENSYSECRLRTTEARIKKLEALKKQSAKLINFPSDFLRNTCTILNMHHMKN